MIKKKILFLGGAFSQLPVIKYARQKGLYIITVDYLPENPGHKLADEYYNISTVEKDSILELSQKLNIDAISAYASDPAAPTAAYVSEKMGLAGSPYKAVNILSDKSCFRKFLNDNKLPCPWHITGSHSEELIAHYNGDKAVLKPVDSSGSKGLKIIENTGDLIRHFDYSKSFSRTGKVILEQYIEKKGPQIHGEGFVKNGELIFLCLGDQVFSKANPLAPLSTIVPDVFHQDILPEVSMMIKDIIHKAGFITGGINIEVIRDEGDNLYFLEIGARNGGNFMPQLMLHATGFDLPKANVDALFNEPFSTEYEISQGSHYAQVILHTGLDGYFDRINIPAELQRNVVEKYLYYKKGEFIRSYENSRDVVGVLIIELKNETDLKIYRGSLINWDWVLTG
jgi:biotin carboxylase